jgi:endonuclease/exonuclease/phosphatase family metal-dependent hydrolase
MTSLTVATYNTESGCRPGFHEHLGAFIAANQPDVVALQEVHNALDILVPETYMPHNRGKRTYPPRLRLYQELCHLYGDDYELTFAPHIYGLHDCEQGTHDVAFGQVTMVRRQTWKVSYVQSGLVFGRDHAFNTEHLAGVSGKPSSKAAISVLITDCENNHSVAISNVHGFWVSCGKIDTPERFAQNLGIVAQIEKVLAWQDTPYILCLGDLNYRSDMAALRHLQGQTVFGTSGRVLNHDFGIQRTRTDHYTNWEQEPEADFMIASSPLADCAVHLRAHLDAPSDHVLFEGRFKIV